MFRFIMAEKIPKNVILTDDPLRVVMLAAHHLNDAKIISDTRGMKAYSGTYNDVPVAAISCGYGKTAAELFIKEAYSLGARNFIYIGECISITGEYALMDIVIAKIYEGRLVKNLKTAAILKKKALNFEDIHTNDRFWLGEASTEGKKIVDFVNEGLYETVKSLNAEALAILVVSENVQNNEKIEESVRQSGLHTALQLALEALTMS